MQGKIGMNLMFCQADDGVSLDEIVRTVRDAYEKKAFSELLKMILQMVQEILIRRAAEGKLESMKCCPDGHFQMSGGFDRRIRTSLGEFKLMFFRVRCSVCGKTFSPLRRFLRMEPYQTKTNEPEKMIVEAVSATNHRRAVRELARDGILPVSFHTAHRRVLRSDCDEIDVSRHIVGSVPVQIMPDGTGYKGAGRDGEARRGDLKVVIGVSQAGDIFPMGTWADVGRAEIAGRWRGQGVTLPDGSILISDGEPGLAEAFAEYASEQQRRHWHINRDLYHAMHRDGGSVRESRPVRNALAGVLAIELPKDDFRKVSDKEKHDIEERMKASEAAIARLIGYLDACGYSTADGYLRRAEIGMFGYIRRWLKWGLISPRASSMVERVMLEPGRRIKSSLTAGATEE